MYIITANTTQTHKVKRLHKSRFNNTSFSWHHCEDRKSRVDVRVSSLSILTTAVCCVLHTPFLKTSERDIGAADTGQTRLPRLTQSVLVFIVIERFYSRIFLFMFSGLGGRQPSPTLSFLFFCLFARLLLQPHTTTTTPPPSISRTYATPHTCTQVRGEGMREDDESFKAASVFQDDLLPSVGWHLCRATF